MGLGFVYYKDLTAANDCGFAPFCLQEPQAGWLLADNCCPASFPNVKHGKGEKGKLFSADNMGVGDQTESYRQKNSIKYT